MFFLKELPSRLMIERYALDHPQADPKSVYATLQMMRQASVLIRRLESFFTHHNLSQLRFLALMVIDRELDRDSLMMNEIAERLDVSRPVTTRTLQTLANDGLVKIKADENDRRSKCVELTKSGQSKLAEVLPGYFDILSEAAGERA